MAEFPVVEGTTVALDFQLFTISSANVKAPLDLTGATVTLILKTKAGVAVDVAGDVSILDAPSGTVRYTPDGADLVAADTPHSAHFRVTDAGSAVAFHPHGKADTWIVHAP